MKNVLKKIISDFHKDFIPELVERDYDIPTNTKKIISIIGPRRAGKTYVLYQIINKLSLKISKKRILYLNFEDERLEFNNNYDLIFESYFELYSDIQKNELYIFFDEIQELENWEKFVRRVYDSITKNIFITGSNSKMLSSDISTSLRGRTLSYEILPLSFKEYLLFNNIEFPDNIYSTKSVAGLRNHFFDYMKFGFYPEIVLTKDKKIKIKILQEYFNTVIYKDLIERYNITNVKLLKYLMKRIYASFTKEYSINKLYNELKSMSFAISKDKLYELVDNLESIYYFYSMEKKSKSVIVKEMSNKKVYTFDNGIVLSLSNKFSKDYGKYFENVIFNELYKKFGELNFYKNSYECDFIYKNKRKNIALQSVYYLNEENYDREMKGLIKTMKKFKIKQGFIIYYESEKTYSDNKNIKIINFLEFYKELNFV